MSSCVILRAKPSLAPTLFYWPSTVIAFACPLVIVIWLLQKIPILVTLFVAVIFFVLAAAVIRIAIEIVSREFTSYTLTDTHLIVQSGIFTRRDSTIPLDRVQSAHVRKALLGQLLHYGTLVVTTAGSGTRLVWLPEPERWEEEIMSRLAAH